MRVLVTGGAGFVGSHLVSRCLREGHEVEVLDDLSAGRAAAVPPGARTTVNDVRDRAATTEAVGRADLVYHLAAAVGVRRVAEDPVGTWSTNVEGTAAVLDACAEWGTRVLVASSSEVYGPAPRERLSEEAPANVLPTGRREVYAVSKAAGEAYALAWWRARDLPVTVVRLFNVVGPGQSDRYGMVLPSFVAAARAGRPLTVHGDGSQRRCFLHVADAVEALCALASSPRSEGLVVNLGSDEEVTILDLARLVLQESGSLGGIEHVPFERLYGEGFSDLPRRRPDLTRLRELTGFRPRLALRDAVRDLLAAAPVA